MTRWLIFPALALLVIALLALAGRDSGADRPPERVWGRRGVRDGDLIRPRAIAIDRKDRLFIVDFTARIQAYDTDGNHLGLTWSTPDYRNGRPSGLSIDRDGNLLVSDSHYHCFRIYDPDTGTQLRCIKAQPGTAPGQLGYVSDVVQDDDGYFYVAEFGRNSRITKMDNSGKFVRCWSRSGLEPGELGRPRALALGPDGNLYVADATNNRILVFSRDGELVRYWGEEGEEPGKLHYPYDLAFNKDGVLYVVEYGNHRVQKFTMTGEPLGCWGGPGRGRGQLNCPWGLAIDSRGKIHIMDTENHRVQRISF